MKIMCIDNINKLPDKETYFNLTVNKWYDIEIDTWQPPTGSDYKVLIRNDRGERCYYDRCRFISIENKNYKK
jgi:hypothetical protein